MAKNPQEFRTYAQKMRRSSREAAYTVIALAVIIVAWLVLGFGLSGLDIEIASTPLWVIGGTIGTWLVAVAASIILAKRVFVNFDLNDEEECDG